MVRIFYYLGLWLAFAKNSLIRQMEYRSSFLGKGFVEIIWMSSTVLFFKSVFNVAPTLVGWSEPEVAVFVGTFLLVDAIYMILLHDNLQGFSELVRSGMLDFYLMRPSSALFLALFRKVSPHALINLGFSLWVVYSGLTHLEEVTLFSSSGLLWAVSVGLGFCVLAGLGTLFVTLSFWFTQTSSLLWLFHEVYRLGSRPETFYQKWIQRLVVSIFPAALFASVPVQIFLNKKSIDWFFYLFAMVFLVWACVLFLWTRGLKRYDGALS